jgi:hypothetical protein
MNETQCDVYTYVVSLVHNYTLLQLHTTFFVAAVLACAPYLSVVQTYVLIYKTPFTDLQIYHSVLYNHY